MSGVPDVRVEVFSRVENRFPEWRSIFSSGEAFSREGKDFLEGRSVFTRGEACSREGKLFLERGRVFSKTSTLTSGTPDIATGTLVS